MVELLNISEDLPITVEYRFRNIYQRLGSRDLQVLAQWNNPLASYSIQKEIVSPTQLTELTTLFDTIFGNRDGFVYIDPLDNVAYESFDTLLGATTRAVAIRMSQAPNEFKYQLCKIYEIGDRFSVRKIFRVIDDGSFNITTALPYTLDMDTGVVTFTTDPGVEEIIWRGRFGVFCRLDTDTLNTIRRTNDANAPECDHYSLANWDFVEIKELSLLQVKENLTGIFDHTFALLAEVDGSNNRKHNTRIEQSDSGFEFRVNRWLFESKDQDLGEKNIVTYLEIQYLIALWRITKGGALGFTYNDVPSHVINNLSITVETDDEQCNDVYSVGELNFVEQSNFGTIYQVLLGSIPDTFTSGSQITLSGLVRFIESGLPAATLPIVINFPFATVPVSNLTTDANGQFSVVLDIRPDLAFPETGTFTLTQAGQVLFESALTTTEATNTPFSIDID